MRFLTPTHLSLLAAILLLLVGFGAERCQRQNLQTQWEENARLQGALQDSVRVTRLANGQLRHEKKTLQGTLSQVKAHNSQLNQQQKELLAQVAILSKKPKAQGGLIAAGSIAYETGIKKPLPSVPATATDTANVVDFTYQSDTLRYQARLRGVRIDSTSRPRLQLTDLQLPNVATVAFQWGTKKEGYPVSFSVQNSNPLYRVSNVESYAIPELRPEIRRRTRAGRLLQTIAKGVKIALPALVVGAGAGYVLGSGH